jgi:hypothetical protein
MRRLSHPFWCRSIVGRCASLLLNLGRMAETGLARQDMKTALAQKPALLRLEASRDR